MINPNWIRWITASCRRHFEDRKGSYYLHFDGMNEDDLKNHQEHAEYRIDGPSVTELVGEYKLDVALNILVQSKIDNDDLDKLKRIAGHFQSAFTGIIEVYRKGDGPDDDQSLLGCLSLYDRVRWNNFGVIDETLKLEQGTIEGRYRLYLDT